MKTRRRTFFAVLISAAVVLLAGAPPLQAQPGQAPGAAPALSLPGEGPWALPDDCSPAQDRPAVAPLATGGPDEFGYTWDDSVGYSWIDGTIDTGLSNNCEDEVQVPIGFTFPYYENSYTSAYVGFNGVLNLQPEKPCSGGYTPSPTSPNNTIAPYWVSMKNSIGQVLYTQGGTEPDRYLAVEWQGVQDFFANPVTFEVVLHENGDITFAYQSMTWGSACAGTGIEDSTGTDGLQYQYCTAIPSGTAVRFARPPAQYRLRIWPLHVGSLAAPGEAVRLGVPVRNTGDLGADTYDLAAVSPWPVELFAPDGLTPLTDTDGDGVPDTGPVAQGDTFTVTVQVQAPADAAVGDHNQAAVTATSSGDPGQSKTAAVHAAVPAPFSRVYYDGTDEAVSLELIQTAARATRQSPGEAAYSTPAVAETDAGGFVSAWPRGYHNGSVYVADVWTATYDRYGHAAGPAVQLTDNSGAEVQTSDHAVGVAAAPDGRIGVVWDRYEFRPDPFGYRRNIYFAVLDAAGRATFGPVNLTQNNDWGWYFGFPDFYDPTVAATDDSHFVLAWERFHGEVDGRVSDIYYTVRDGDGDEIKPITRWTFDPPDYDGGYVEASAARVSGSRVLVVWTGEAQDDIYYGVLDSGGGVVKSPTNLSTDASAWIDEAPDAVYLPNGQSVVAWRGDSGDDHRIRYALLSSDFSRTFGPATLDDPGTIMGSDEVSLAADAASRATLTWMEYGACQMNLYYALLDGSGGVLGPPMPFHTSPAGCTYSSRTGFGNTAYSWEAPPDVDGVAAFESAVVGGRPGGSAALGLLSANHGTLRAQSVQVTLTLDPELTYLGDTSGVPPTFAGDDVIWDLSDLAFLDEGRFVVSVGLPAGVPPGTTFAVTMTLASAGPEWYPDDNVATAQVVAAAQVYVPLVLRNHRPDRQDVVEP